MKKSDVIHVMECRCRTCRPVPPSHRGTNWPVYAIGAALTLFWIGVAAAVLAIVRMGAA